MSSSTVTTVTIINGTYTDPAGFSLFDINGELITTLCRYCAEAFDRDLEAADNDPVADTAPLGYWAELDAPLHCEKCEALIVTALTPEGVEYLTHLLSAPGCAARFKQAWAEGFADYLICGRCGEEFDAVSGKCESCDPTPCLNAETCEECGEEAHARPHNRE